MLVGLQSKRELLRGVQNIKLVTGGVMLACIVLALFLSNVLATVLLRPLTALQSVMKRVEQNQLEARFHSVYQDEVAQVGYKFNRMLEQIVKLIDDFREAEHGKRQMEIKALQAQIEPHFLYNTLNTILWKSETEQHEDVREMIMSLSLLFQLGLNGGEEMTTLYKEVEHVRHYLQLQQQCYEGLFQYEIDMDPELKDCAILKIILQPLVENSILHGFRDMNRGGRIHVAIKRGPAELKISVEDNGSGFNAKELDEKLQDDNVPKKGYALRNISSRLKLYYGNEAHLEFESEPFKSNKITLRIPLAVEGGQV